MRLVDWITLPLLIVFVVVVFAAIWTVAFIVDSLFGRHRICPWCGGSIKDEWSGGRIDSIDASSAYRVYRITPSRN